MVGFATVSRAASGCGTHWVLLNGPTDPMRFARALSLRNDSGGVRERDVVSACLVIPAANVRTPGASLATGQAARGG